MRFHCRYVRKTEENYRIDNIFLLLLNLTIRGYFNNIDSYSSNTLKLNSHIPYIFRVQYFKMKFTLFTYTHYVVENNFCEYTLLC